MSKPFSPSHHHHLNTLLNLVGKLTAAVIVLFLFVTIKNVQCQFQNNPASAFPGVFSGFPSTAELTSGFSSSGESFGFEGGPQDDSTGFGDFVDDTSDMFQSGIGFLMNNTAEMLWNQVSSAMQ